MRELRNDDGVVVRIFAVVGQVGESPRGGGMVEKPLPRLCELVLNILQQISIAGDEADLAGIAL